MASTILAVARVSRGFGPSLNIARQLASPKCIRRGLHQSPVALKKAKHEADVDGDLFGSISGESLFEGADDLFDSGETSSQDSTTTTTSKRSRLNPEERLKRFNDLFTFVSKRIGLKPEVHDALQVRNSSWQHLFGLATTKEQMESIVDLFPKWRDSRRAFTDNQAIAFVRRCEELHCPEIALQVFSNHPKYGFDLTSVIAGRRLLHSLHVEHPLDASITLAALYRVYKLPPISSDLVSCAMLTSACFKHATPQSLTVANALIPSLQKLLEKTDPKSWELPKDWKERERVREKAWLAWTLNKVEKALLQQGKEAPVWLRQWREESGHAQLAT